MKATSILIAALEKAAFDYRALQPTPSLLGSDAPPETMNALAAEIDRCETYRAIAGKVLFSGGSGPVLASHSLASRLFSKGVRWGNDIPVAADWLIRLMTTRETTGLFKAAIWGLEVGTEVSVSKTTRLMPFAALPDSYMRGRLVERARRCCDGSRMTQSYFDIPSVAYVEQVELFPYIRSDNAAFLKMNELIWRVHGFLDHRASHLCRTTFGRCLLVRIC